MNPISIMNHKICKCIETLTNYVGDFDATESQLLQLLVMKRAMINIGKMEDEIQKDKEKDKIISIIKSEYVRARRAKGVDSLGSSCQDDAPCDGTTQLEPKRRAQKARKVKQLDELTDSVVTQEVVEPTQEQIAAVPGFVQEHLSKTEPEVSETLQKTEKVSDPFGQQPDVPQTMEEFFKQEKLKALSALNDEQSI